MAYMIAKSAPKQPRNVNHPKKGASIKVEPIRRLEDIAAIKSRLSGNPRDLCLFTFGINTGYRAGEILTLTVGQVSHLKAGDRLEIKQSKVGKYRSVTVNGAVVAALENWLHEHPNPANDAPLFISRTGKKALKVSSVNAMIKSWCADIGLQGNYGTHTMRKTWGYHQRVQQNRPIPLLMVAFGHTTQAQTLDYLCIQDSEIESLYDLEL
ncbi:tyrosine-type recombinase/integrase [uncultured Roseobacter sp.]|uniref:tyrosine-type recombinase/integrase n=1 Tax=uncultured Roseobacter sp. TaxID=114847 RepID=UPI002619F298|nr:tyrosine-type recombinase/integrase [uncultured Roseobacter sp.]